MPPTTSQLKVVPIPRKVSGEGKDDGKIKVVDGFAQNYQGKAYSLARNIVREFSARVN